MSHRICKAIRSGDTSQFGNDCGAVEVDETLIGCDFNKEPKGEKKSRGYDSKIKVLSFVDRTAEQTSSFVVDDLISVITISLDQDGM